MPSNYLEIDQIRESLGRPASLPKEGFTILSSIHKDADKAVQQVLDFLRLWSAFHFPQLLRALDRIQRDVFRRVRERSGDYSFYASRIENRFLSSGTGCSRGVRHSTRNSP